jgi:hypothetical protein
MSNDRLFPEVGRAPIPLDKCYSALKERSIDPTQFIRYLPMMRYIDCGIGGGLNLLNALLAEIELCQGDSNPDYDHLIAVFADVIKKWEPIHQGYEQIDLSELDGDSGVIEVSELKNVIPALFKLLDLLKNKLLQLGTSRTLEFDEELIQLTEMKQKLAVLAQSFGNRPAYQVYRTLGQYRDELIRLFPIQMAKIEY